VGKQRKGDGVETYLRRLMEIEGVTGALIVGKDGLVIASTLDRDHEEMLGAMAAACFDASSRYIDQIGMGAVRFALFETPGGYVQIADGGEILLVAQSSAQAGMGRIRMEIIQMVRQLGQQLSPR
jgi:predicted regulator of Ras-like GTPase activity (Roadblock/LC7/MglB family)